MSEYPPKPEQETQEQKPDGYENWSQWRKEEWEKNKAQPEENTEPDPDLYGESYVADVSGEETARYRLDEKNLTEEKEEGLKILEQRKKEGEAFNVIDKRDRSWLEPPEGSDEESYHVAIKPDGERVSMDDSEFATPDKLTPEEEERRKEIYKAEKEGTGFRVKDSRSEEAKKVFSSLNPEEKSEQTKAAPEATVAPEPKVEPQNQPPVASGEKEQNKEKIVVNSEEVKNAIASQIEGMAKLEKIDISEIPEGLLFKAELNAGLSGGKIEINGKIVNAGDGIDLNDLDIKARDYVKDIVMEDLSRFSKAIKTHFEKQNKKPVSKIKIVGPNIEIEFKSGAPEGKRFSLKAKFREWYGKLGKAPKKTALAEMTNTKQPEGSKNQTPAPDNENKLPPRKGFTPEVFNSAAVPIEGTFVNPEIFKWKTEKGLSLSEILGEVFKKFLKAKNK